MGVKFKGTLMQKCTRKFSIGPWKKRIFKEFISYIYPASTYFFNFEFFSMQLHGYPYNLFDLEALQKIT